MFFHGIDYEYLLIQYPVLSPRLAIHRQNRIQQRDRQHLIEQFGFEPVHFLESSSSYPVKRCLKSCFSFGNVVFAFSSLSQPLIQLSNHEVGVPVVDTRQAKAIFVQNRQIIEKLKKRYNTIPVFHVPPISDRI